MFPLGRELSLKRVGASPGRSGVFPAPDCLERFGTEESYQPPSQTRPSIVTIHA